MKAPRFRITSIMLIVAVAALNLGVLQARILRNHPFLLAPCRWRTRAGDRLADSFLDRSPGRRTADDHLGASRTYLWHFTQFIVRRRYASVAPSMFLSLAFWTSSSQLRWNSLVKAT